MKRYFFTITLALCVATASAQINYENSRRLETGWQFVRGDMGNIWEAVRPMPPKVDAAELVPLWSEVTVPHCFNALDAVDPSVNYYQGSGWYRTQLAVENPYEGGRTLLHFEGAGQTTEVWIYMTRVAIHVGGYDEWTVDVTDAVAEFLASGDAERFGGRVPLSVRCDNSRNAEIIPSDLSDFNLYGGLYRYVNLVYTPAVAVLSLAVDTETDADGKRGRLTITPEYRGVSHEAWAEVTVRDPAGEVVFHRKKTAIEAGRFQVEVARPSLWSPENPALYTVELTLSAPTKTGAMEANTVRDSFGFRHFEFVEHGPFILNGERLLLRGTHRHEDHAGVGAAMDEATILREMEMIKAMGANFIRLGHYQQSRIVLDACDRLGLLVWEEIPWCRGGLGGENYKEQARRMLANMITQHRNHPSIILWGLGNENDWPNDFPTFDREAIRAFMTELHELSHSLDDSRLTAIRRCDFCSDIVDVYSPSIWAGWYSSSSYTDYKRLTESAIASVPRFLHAEWGGDSHAGRHAENPLGWLEANPGKRAPAAGLWDETYICDLIDWTLKEQETMPMLTGAAFWPFKDFSTPLRPENPVPYMNQKGVVERDLTPKEAFWVFQSYWTSPSEAPMVHIYGHSWPIRWGGAGELSTVKVYSNCPSVELFVNGVSQGVRHRDAADFPAAGLRWEVLLTAGANELRAVGDPSGGRVGGFSVVEDAVSVEYETRSWGAPAAIELTSWPALEPASGSALEPADGSVWVEAQLVDADGVPCLDSRAYIEFSAAGDGYLIDNQGTSSGSRLLQAYNGRARIRVATGPRSVGAPGGVAASPRGLTATVSGSDAAANTVVAASSPGLPTAIRQLDN